MNISFHLEVPMNFVTNNRIPHSILHEHIQLAIRQEGETQKDYKYTSNGVYFFIYTDDGNRFDIEL